MLRTTRARRRLPLRVARGPPSQPRALSAALPAPPPPIPATLRVSLSESTWALVHAPPPDDLSPSPGSRACPAGGSGSLRQLVLQSPHATRKATDCFLRQSFGLRQASLSRVSSGRSCACPTTLACGGDVLSVPSSFLQLLPSCSCPHPTVFLPFPSPHLCSSRFQTTHTLGPQERCVSPEMVHKECLFFSVVLLLREPWV